MFSKGFELVRALPRTPGISKYTEYLHVATVVGYKNSSSMSAFALFHCPNLWQELELSNLDGKFIASQAAWERGI